MQWRRLREHGQLLILSAVIGLTACQAPDTQLNAPVFSPATQAPFPLRAANASPQKFRGHAQGRVKPDPAHPGKAKVTLSLHLQQAEGFKTQAVQQAQLTQVHAAILGSGLGSEGIYADTADASGVVQLSGGTLTLNFSNVPYGPGKILRLAFSGPLDENNLREEVQIGAAFDLNEGTTSLEEVSYRTTPVADVFFRLWHQSEDNTLSLTQRTKALQVLNQLSLTELQNFVDQDLTVKTGTAPGYSYLRHPAGVDSAVLTAALLANNGNIQALKAEAPHTQPLPYYQIPGWQVTGSISGLVSTDTLQLHVTDPVSTALQDQGNGTYTLSGIQGQRGLFGSTLFLRGIQTAGTHYSIQYLGDLPEAPHAPGALLAEPPFNGTFTRDLVLVPATPSLSSLTPASAQAGAVLTLTGQNFHLNTDGNTVLFGGSPVATADISVISETEIQVKVPAGLTEAVPVSVSVGSQVSNSLTFTPYIASDAKTLLSFSFLTTHNPGLSSDVTASINGQTVWLTLPEGTSLNALKASFSASAGASVYVEDSLQQTGSSVQNFAFPLEYTVQAEDGSSQTYQVVVQSALAALDNQAQSLMSTYNIPGMTLSIARNGQLVYAKAYGEANTQTQEKVTNRHLFRIASISKPLTAALILKLAETGAFALDDKVFGPGALLGTTYGSYPYGQYIEAISVRDLLEHKVGGWPNDGNDPVFQQLNLSQADLMAHILNNCPGSPCPLGEAPGTSAVYSNAGYFVLGRIIEAVTGQSYESALKAHLAAPLGITDMHIGSDSLAGRRSNEVIYYPQEPYPAYNNFNLPRIDAVGGWIAAGPDLVRLLYDVEINHGWSPYTAYTAWNHTGSLPGTGTLFVRDSTVPGSVYTWSVLTNTRSSQGDFFSAMQDSFLPVIRNTTVWPQYE